MSDARQYAPVTERNRQPILTVLQQILPQSGTVLEIASGTGEHITFFAPRMAQLQWLPSEPQALGRASIQAWGEALGVKNLHLPPLDLDVSVHPWLVETPAFLEALKQPITAIVAINLIHIAPWPICSHLMAGAERILPVGGVLYLYGPYKQGGQHTAASNEAFDQMLRDRNPAWGVRDLEAVVDTAQAHRLQWTNTLAMPANNLSVVFRRQ